MGKYYIRSGQIKRVIGASDSREAIYKVVRQELSRWCGTLALGDTIVASEQGFDDPTDAAEVPTGEFLVESGLGDELGLHLGIPMGCSPEDNSSALPRRFRIFALDWCTLESDGQVRELKTWGASGWGKTLHVWQVEGQPLCIDVYPFETDTYSAALGKEPYLELELDHPMPDASVLRALTFSTIFSWD